MISKTDKTKNSKRMSRGLLVGLIAVLVLSVSVVAAYGSTSGYGKYKDAVNDLLLQEDNVSLTAEYEFSYDGEKVYSEVYDYKIDGKNHSSHSYNGSDDYEYFGSVINGTSVSFCASDTEYYETSAEDTGYGFLLETTGCSEQVLKFAELLADSLVGDLKNNVVLVGEENGVSQYELEVTGEQLPAVINAGLEVLIASAQDMGGYVSYEDYDTAFSAFYQKSTGKALPEDYFDKLYADDPEKVVGYDELWEEYSDYSTAMDDYYNEILSRENNDKAILYVKNDGTYQVYNSYVELTRVLKDSSDPFSYLDANALFESGNFYFTLDENNRLLTNHGSMTYHFTDKQGQTHRLECSVKLELSDYGTTEVTPFDTGNRTRYTEEY